MFKTWLREELQRVGWLDAKLKGAAQRQFILRMRVEDEFALLEDMCAGHYGEVVRGQAHVGGARSFPHILGFVVEWGADKLELIAFEDASRDTLLAIVRAVADASVPSPP
jgi:hypothetical protein